MTRVGLVWRREWDATDDRETCRLREVFAAFDDVGVRAEPLVWSDDEAEPLRARLPAFDGVLVWVNPIEAGRDRTLLDAALRDAAAAGVFVSAHPDVIRKLGTKQVLWDTRELSWGSDVRLHRSADDLRAGLRLDEGPRVLKRYRGSSGDGVWKLEAAGGGDVLVQHATGDGEPERISLDAFLERCAGGFPVVDQPYVERLADGMIRAYLTHERVVGFTHQYPRGLMPPGPDDRPTGKRFESPDTVRYAALRARLEGEWVPELQRILELDTHDLPVIWDVDLLFGDGAEDYVLCEINCSSTFAFPEFAMEGVARAAVERIASSRRQLT